MTIAPARRMAHAARLAWHWQARSLVVPALPQIISLEVTNRCNFACSFCPQSDPEHFADNAPGALTPDRAARVLRRIREAGSDTEMMSWTLDGEPFMNRQFPAILARARDLGFTTHHFASNGALMDLERLRALPRGCRYVILPDFCADEAEFEAVRGPNGSWRTVLDNLVAALTAPELDHVELHVGDIAPRVGGSRVDLKRRRQALVDLLPDSRRLTVYPVGRPHNVAGVMGEPVTVGPKYRVCPYPWTTMYIAWTGDVVACCRDLRRQTVLGNLFEESLWAIWNGPQAQALRRDLRDERPGRQAACAGCSMPWTEPEKFGLRNLVSTARTRLKLFREVAS